jgi:DNA-binding transcriptional MocR family regulator
MCGSPSDPDERQQPDRLPPAVPLREHLELRWAFARPFASRARLRALAAPPHPLGWPALRREIARYLASRGIPCTADDVAVVVGLQIRPATGVSAPISP